MPRRPEFILQISIRNIEDFSPLSVAKSPRTFRPADVANACRNIDISSDPKLPRQIFSLSQYILTEFFCLSHASGLYNRQIKLWEELSKIQSVEIHQSNAGIFGLKKLPEYELSFLDHKKRRRIVAYYASQLSNDASYLNRLKTFINNQSSQQDLCGLFACFPTPFPSSSIDFIKKETGSSGGDKLAAFESILPKLSIPINLLEIDESPNFNPETQLESHSIRLIHPDLSKKKTP